MTTAVEVLERYQAHCEPREIPRVEYSIKHAERLLPMLDHLDNEGNLQRCNDMLSATGHEELLVRDPVAMPPLEFVPNPIEPNHLGLFAKGFRMYGGHPSSQDDRRVEIPLDIPSLQEMMYRRIDLRTIVRYGDHRARPAFYRAICLNPGFMINLTADISSKEVRLDAFKPEIFLAYRIMSRLVDRSDRGAVRSSGRVNRGYLFTRHLR